MTITSGLSLLTLLLLTASAQADIDYDDTPPTPPPEGIQTLEEDVTYDNGGGRGDFTLDCYNRTWEIRLISIKLFNQSTGSLVTCNQIDLDESRMQCNSKQLCYLSVYYPGERTCRKGNGALLKAEVKYECLQAPNEQTEIFPMEAGSISVADQIIAVKSGFNYPYYATLNPYDTTCSLNLEDSRGRVTVDTRELTYDRIGVPADDVPPFRIKFGNQQRVPEIAVQRQPIQIQTPTEIQFNMLVNYTMQGRFWIVLTAEQDKVMNVTCTNNGRQWLLEDSIRGRGNGSSGSNISGLLMVVAMVIGTFTVM